MFDPENNLSYKISTPLNNFTWHGWLRLDLSETLVDSFQYQTSFCSLYSTYSVSSIMLSAENNPSESNPLHLNCFIQDNEGNTIARVDDNDYDTSSISTTFFTPNFWNHIAIICDNSTISFAVNGVCKKQWSTYANDNYLERTANIVNPFSTLDHSDSGLSFIGFETIQVQAQFDAWELLPYAMWNADFYPPIIEPKTDNNVFNGYTGSGVDWYNKSIEYYISQL
jgi:hypothetical protein